MSHIRWLGEDDCHHETVVGGKAASLSRLASLHAVPPGFAIPAIPAGAPGLPDPLASAIEIAYQALGERYGIEHPAVAVRSSALDEDGADAAFAGQHDTYLNVRGCQAVLDAVHRCIQSAASAEALDYRRQRGISAEDVRMAVLVQQLVHADVAAVVFSANPITGSRDEVMINANWGLGESIVGGIATPDTYVVQKDGLELLWSDIAHKERMTIMMEHGTTEAEVPLDLQKASSLDDAQIREVAQLALMLEGAVGHPVDVECAIAGGTLYLLQCRPITTLG